MSFWRSQKVNSEEFTQLSIKITQLEEQVKRFRLDVKLLEDYVDKLSYKFSSKMYGKAKEEIKKDEDTQNINNQVLLPHRDGITGFTKF